LQAEANMQRPRGLPGSLSWCVAAVVVDADDDAAADVFLHWGEG